MLRISYGSFLTFACSLCAAGQSLVVEVVANRPAHRNEMGYVWSKLRDVVDLPWNDASVNVTMLDLSKRGVTHIPHVNAQSDRAALKQAWYARTDRLTTARVDHGQDAQFFASEVRKRLESFRGEAGKRVLIVISEPRRFPKGEDLRPVARVESAQVIYLQCDSSAGVEVERPAQESMPFATADGGGISLPGGYSPGTRPGKRDQIRDILATLRPRVVQASARPWPGWQGIIRSAEARPAGGGQDQ